MIPLTHSPQKINQVDSKKKYMGESYMIPEKVMYNIKLLGPVSIHVTQGVTEVSQLQIHNFNHSFVIVKPEAKSLIPYPIRP